MFTSNNINLQVNVTFKKIAADILKIKLSNLEIEAVKVSFLKEFFISKSMMLIFLVKIPLFI